MLITPKLSIRGDVACLTFTGPSSGQIKSAVSRHIAKNGQPKTISGMDKLGRGFLATFQQKLYYQLGAK